MKFGTINNPEDLDLGLPEANASFDSKTGLMFQAWVDQNDKTQINHSLVTAVIAPDGKVTKILKGNEWTVDDLLSQLKAAI